ncbi:MAG: type II toxin-antitoxin system PemK/MazF family toxin [Candidatus Micrarchaeota archaeon]
MIIKRGDVIRADLEPVKGSEQGKIRPCLVIQNDIGNSFSTTTIIAPLTSRIENEDYPFVVFVKAGEGGLPKDSLVLLNQIRTISMENRILDKLGSLSNETMKKVDNALKVSLSLD